MKVGRAVPVIAFVLLPAASARGLDAGAMRVKRR
jgi:hypothetical protein